MYVRRIFQNNTRCIARMNIHLVFYYIGITIIFLTHLMMAVMDKGMRTHALINLFAAACIAYYFMFREGYIKF